MKHEENHVWWVRKDLKVCSHNLLKGTIRKFTCRWR